MISAARRRVRSVLGVTIDQFVASREQCRILAMLLDHVAQLAEVVHQQPLASLVLVALATPCSRSPTRSSSSVSSTSTAIASACSSENPDSRLRHVTLEQSRAGESSSRPATGTGLGLSSTPSSSSTVATRSSAPTWRASSRAIPNQKSCSARSAGRRSSRSAHRAPCCAFPERWWFRALRAWSARAEYVPLCAAIVRKARYQIGGCAELLKRANASDKQRARCLACAPAHDPPFI